MLPVQSFTAFIQQNQLFKADDVVLAAVSGGMDSVLLVHLLKAAGFTFAIAHCNFQLRNGEAEADQAFCKQLALDMGVPFHTINFETSAYAAEQKSSIQMAARQLRYQWFGQLCQEHNYAAVASAHHQNDTIETILLNLTRGTGIAGLHGILPKNNLLVRPLLFLNREEITGLISQHHLAYAEDSSNASTKYARNKLRHQVIPKLKELNPNLEQTFERNLTHFRELEQLLQQQVAMAKNQVWTEHGKEIHLSLTGISQLYPQRLLLSGMLKDYGFNDTTIDDLISSLNKHSGRVFESAGYILVLDRDKLILSSKIIDTQSSVTIDPEDETARYGNYTFQISCTDEPGPIAPNANIAMIDSGLLIYPLTLRSWRQGDYFMPLGMSTRKKLSDFFVNQKVPVHQKTQTPILINGNGEVIWIAGYRLDNRYKLTAQTKKVTIFEILK
ncbi:tRNA lysidine(34) synthetase TilS [Mucilaginibacter terrae]|uniref:tRNA lysidine(34) synthetase TilS n=1 Tax=Mucilaginibacter terrae TaxID=1955052 RepID=UPI00362ECD0B